MTSVTQSLRILRKHWKLSLIGWVSLSIAMALGVISLSISNTFLLLPPSAPEPDRLVNIYSRSTTGSGAPAVDQISYPDFTYYRANNRVFTDIAAAPNSITLLTDNTYAKREVRLAGRPVSENYFSVLGIRPFLGRLFQAGDDASQAQIAVMTYACWTRLGSDSGIIGKTVAGVTITGVTPKEFTGAFYGLNGDLLFPLNRLDDSPWRTRREERRLILIARLKSGITRQQAHTDMALLATQLARAFPKEDKDRTTVVQRATLLPPDALASAQLASGILTGIVVLVLLIACANVASLLLAVAVGRRQEASIKLALGAPRWRLTAEFLQESAILCFTSGATGYALADAIITRVSELTFNLPIFGTFSLGLHLKLDLTVISFTVVLVVISILATGVAPALYASSPHLAQALGGEIVVGGTRKNFRRSALVVVQIAICTLVLVGMGLCQRSLYNLRHADPGFSARNLVGADVYLRGNGISEDKGRQLYVALRSRLGAIPGVTAVTLASQLPLMGGQPAEVAPAGGTDKLQVTSSVVDSAYFSTFGIPLLAGRTFGAEDQMGHPEAVIVNRKLADMLYPRQNPIGRTLMQGNTRATIVGIVPNGKYGDLYEAAGPVLYSALEQHYQDSLHVVIRTQGDPGLWVEPLARELRNLSLASPFQPFTYEHWLGLALLGERVVAWGVAALSGLGIFLATVGLFGAVSWSVSERRKELGIRVALGARTWQLQQMVARQIISVAAIGVAIGLIPGIAITIMVRSLLFEVSAVEPVVLVTASGAMLALCLLVATLSARPWLKVDPMEAVRHS